MKVFVARVQKVVKSPVKQPRVSRAKQIVTEGIDDALDPGITIVVVPGSIGMPRAHFQQLLRLMAEDENVESMFLRFSKVVYELKLLEMVYSNALQVRKLVRSLPKACEQKMSFLKMDIYRI